VATVEALPLAPGTRRAPSRPAERPDHQPDLRVVDPRPRRRRRPRRHVTGVLCAILLTGSLMAVVIGHSVLAERQIRLTGLQSSLAAAQATERSRELSVAELETPARIVAEAENQDHMVPATQVPQVPSVPLDHPERTPNVAGSSTTPQSAAGG